jgi:hypothetical protein
VGEQDGLALVLHGGRVIPEEESMGPALEKAITLSAFLAYADMDTLAAGFAFVRSVDSTAANKIAERNERLRNFLAQGG